MKHEDHEKLKAETKKKKRETPDDLETPAKKKSNGKNKVPEGMGGRTVKALSCIICSRPRECDQRGTACPTCLNVMRSNHVRSIEKVLSDEGLKDKIQKASVEIKPVPTEEDGFGSALRQMEKLFRQLNRMAK